MKKLFYIFAILFTVFNTTAWGDSFQDVQSLLESKGFFVWSEYDSLPPECTRPIKQELDIPYTDDKTSFTCGYTNYYCKKGQLPSECAPCALSLLSNIYIDNFTTEFAKVAYQNGAIDERNIMFNTYESKYPEWATTACNNMFQNKTNQEYANALRDPNNWQKHEAQPAVSAPRTDTTTSNTITVSGTVEGNYQDSTKEPLIGATVQALDSDNKLIKGAITDIDGKYTLENIPDNAKIKISYLGFQPQTLYIYEADKKNITLQEGMHRLEDVIVTACKAKDRENLNASDHQLHYESNTCIPLICKTGFTLVTANNKQYTMSSECQENVNSDECAFRDFGIKCLKTTGNCATDKHADTSEYVLKEGTYVCEIKTCKSGYKPNGDKTACIKMAKKCKENDAKKLEDAGASDTGLRAGSETCIALYCKCGYTLNGEECVPWEKDKDGKYTKPCEKSELEKLNAKSGILACNDRGKAFCEITECISSDYIHNTEKNTCDSKNKNPCDTIPENATDAEYRTVDGKLVCTINKCADGYERNADKTKCNPTPKLSREDSKKKIAELQENADAMRAKEQSTENKLLGGASMAATGIGGMQAMSALAEQSADADAEAAMRAYLATFHCNYGGGINIPGGEKDVQLPGGNELVGLYSEYVNLANDLKVRKNALGMKPGIESESILDSATSGLYDDVAIGKTSGAFTSLARAMMDPNGADAAAWAAQKSDTADKLKTGATIAGIGAVGGAVGNLLINKNAPKENSRQINAEYDLKRQIFQNLEQEINNLPPAPVPATTKCPDGANGTHPNCTCTKTNQIYVEKTNTCDTCPGAKININGKCDCLSPLVPGEGDSCVNPTPSDKCPGDNRAYYEQTKQCVCINGYQLTDDKKCECPTATHHVENSQCVKNATPVITPNTPQEITINLPADTLFAHGSANLTQDAKNALNNFITNLSTKKFINCKIEIRGYTDGTGTDNFNQKLSQQRADAVKNHLTSQQNSPIETGSTATGMGEGHCSCAAGEIPTDKKNDTEYKQCVGKNPNYTNNNNLRFAPCRKVTITVNADDCKSTMENATINLLDPNSLINPTTIKN